MSDLKITGRIKVIGELQTFDSGFQKQQFVVTTSEQYPQDIALELYRDKVDKLNGLNEGDDVTVSFNLRGNEYNGKYYVNLQAWKIEVNQAAQLAPAGNDTDDADPF